MAVLLLLRLLLRFHQLAAPKASGDDDPGRWLTERRLFLGLAYGLALFFGLSYANIEMVTFSHIHGYLLFLILVLGALLLLSEVLAEPRASSGEARFPPCWSLPPGLGLVIHLRDGSVLCRRRRGCPGDFDLANGAGALRAVAVFVLFASILPIYRGINLLDHLAHPVVHLGHWDSTGRWDDSRGTTIWERLSLAPTLKNAIRYVCYTTVQPFFPSSGKLLLL